MPPTSLLSDAYLVMLGILGIYGVHRVSHLWRFRWPERCGEAQADTGELARVTVQLPLYNERTVAARVIRAVGEIDWPAERLEIQVLDDSTDETCAIVDDEVARLVARGLDAKVVRRTDRTGYKAGALDYGMRTAKGEMFCVFDADFLPQPDFLRRVMPSFGDAGVGMVQARWEHVNREESLLTRAQSTLLDGHFVIEHTVRARSGWFFNFNGTAGIWRRAAIEGAGGWQHDTLTEDLDLSYRSQLAGWRFAYLPLVAAPAEIPPDITAFKSQQHRWAKGSVQVARKLARPIAQAKVPLRVKLEAAAHLSGNVGYPVVLLLAILLPFSIGESSRMNGSMHLLSFVACTLSVILFYDRSQRVIGRTGRARLRDVPAAMALGIGMCVSQTRAVFEGLCTAGKGAGEFVRTPKRGDRATSQYAALMGGLPGIELLLAAWLWVAMVHAMRIGKWGSLPFLLLFFSGFAWVGALSLQAWFVRLRAARQV